MKLKLEQQYDKRTTKAMQAWILLVRTFGKIRAYELSFINKNALTMNQFEVLELLYHRGALPVSTITKLIKSTPGNVTVVIKNLQRDAFVSIKADISDKRARVVDITDSGKSVISSMFDEHSQNLKSCFEALDDDELDKLFTLLRKVYKTKLKEIG
ncbi:MAG: MarR family transcriptional regulator [Campylobacteraceae bacterium]|jgi:MarR family 2-MHQ and catechol resistance regulon transcriptional repressor|nr:MarR family transcriptional regulator [Campylobacteraceae bacterium]